MLLFCRRNRPLDASLRERLHLKSDSVISLCLLRAVLQSSDALSTLLTRKPFFALREGEDLLEKLDGLQGVDLVNAVLRENGGTRITAHGLAHIPKTGPVIIAAAHPTGMFDFLAHAGILLKHRPDLKVVANQEVERFLGADIMIPVQIDKQNRATSATRTHRAMLDHMKTGGALFIFGSGRVPNQKDGQLFEPAWRSGASRLSETSNAPVIPAALNSQNSDYYYRIRALAQTISGGNDNFGAMIGSLRYLAEFLSKLGGQYEVSYGPPLPPGTDAQTLQSAAESLVPGLYHRS